MNIFESLESLFAKNNRENMIYSVCMVLCVYFVAAYLYLDSYAKPEENTKPPCRQKDLRADLARKFESLEAPKDGLRRSINGHRRIVILNTLPSTAH